MGTQSWIKQGMLFKKGTLSTETEYYRNTGKKAFQNIVAIFKINSINFSFFFFFGFYM